ncbi:hypothetical protein Taro_027607 [Colocasia esculenta]|uniref:Uncharacterized protein n=1 Tax=Colocasia esculenta TaxID=4460 RepID=A0A843VP92_COLES|nr:hypothetical protein [Colocasia esculenta]
MNSSSLAISLCVELRGCSVWALGCGCDEIPNRDQVATYRCIAFSLNASQHLSRLAKATGYVASVQEIGVSTDRDLRVHRDDIATRYVSRETSQQFPPRRTEKMGPQ